MNYKWYLFPLDGKVMVLFLIFMLFYQYVYHFYLGQSTFHFIVASNFDIRYVIKQEAEEHL